MAHSETRGIYPKKGIYWFQMPMHRGIRPPAVTLQTRDLKEAIDRAALIRSVPNLQVTDSVRDEIKRFLKFKTDRRAYSRSTAKVMAYRLQAFAAWLGAAGTGGSPELITTAHVQKFYEATLAAQSIATAHKALMAVRAFFRWLLEVERKVRQNPALGVRQEPVPDGSRPVFCSRQLQDKLIAECPREDLKVVLMLGFHSGLRKNEIIQAVPQWFNLESRSIDLASTSSMTFNRHKRARSLPMRQVLHEFLTSYGLREPFLLRPEVKQGKDIYRYDFDSALQSYVKAQGVPWVTAKVMRNTFASLLVQDGTSIFKVAKWLGDTVAVAEKHYAHLMPKDDDIELRGQGKMKRSTSSKLAERNSPV